MAEKDDYKEKWIAAIKKLDTIAGSDTYDENLGNIIDKIYSDGFQDGKDEGQDADSVREGMAAEKEWQRESRD